MTEFFQRDTKWEKKRTIWLTLGDENPKGIYWFTHLGRMEELVSCISVSRGFVVSFSSSHSLSQSFYDNGHVISNCRAQNCPWQPLAYSIVAKQPQGKNSSFLLASTQHPRKGCLLDLLGHVFFPDWSLQPAGFRNHAWPDQGPVSISVAGVGARRGMRLKGTRIEVSFKTTQCGRGIPKELTGWMVKSCRCAL